MAYTLTVTFDDNSIANFPNLATIEIVQGTIAGWYLKGYVVTATTIVNGQVTQATAIPFRRIASMTANGP